MLLTHDTPLLSGRKARKVCILEVLSTSPCKWERPKDSDPSSSV